MAVTREYTVKNGKSVGPDYIPNEVLKCNQVLKAFQVLLNVCFNHSITPTIWNKAFLVPIPKGASKDPHIPTNYRGISLLSCAAKLYSAIINNRIGFINDSEESLVKEQNGFRKNRSCEDHIYTLTSLIENKIGSKKEIFTAFIDFEKAFDRVDRTLMFYKLLKFFKIEGKLYKAVKSLYNNSSTCIRLNNYFTDWFDSTLGVRQGDTLSPQLFSMYINDLATDIKNLNCGVNFLGEESISILLYADDIILMSENVHDLQRMLNCLYDWCSKWRLTVNNDKSKIIHFRPSRRKQTDFEFKYGTESLECVGEYKYLGFYLNSHLDYKKSVVYFADAATGALGALRNKTSKLKDMHFLLIPSSLTQEWFQY